jgi:hypothetical protein
MQRLRKRGRERLRKINKCTLTDRQIDRQRVERKRETQRYANRKRENGGKKIGKQKCSNKGAKRNREKR